APQSAGHCSGVASASAAGTEDAGTVSAAGGPGRARITNQALRPKKAAARPRNPRNRIIACLLLRAVAPCVGNKQPGRRGPARARVEEQDAVQPVQPLFFPAIGPDPSPPRTPTTSGPPGRAWPAPRPPRGRWA